MPSMLPQVEPLSQEWNEKSLEQSDSLGSPRLAGRAAVLAYVEAWRGDAALADCLVLYLTKHLKLLAQYKLSCAASGPIPTVALIAEGKKLGAAGFLLVEPNARRTRRIDKQLISETSRLRSISHEFDMPLVDYLIICGKEIMSVGGLRECPPEDHSLEL